MKKIAILVSLLFVAVIANAQPKAIGARVGGDVELSWQQWAGDNFIEADFGFHIGKHSGFCLTAVYDFDFEIGSGFEFYAGPGAQLGSYKVDDKDKFGIAAGGQVGIGFTFPKTPLNISVDWRPMVRFLGDASWTSAAIGVRYSF